MMFHQVEKKKGGLIKMRNRTKKSIKNTAVLFASMLAGFVAVILTVLFEIPMLAVAVLSVVPLVYLTVTVTTKKRGQNIGKIAFFYGVFSFSIAVQLIAFSHLPHLLGALISILIVVAVLGLTSQIRIWRGINLKEAV